MENKQDLAKITLSKFQANGAWYFGLFDQHIPTGLTGNILLLSLGNLDCVAKVVKKNPVASYTVVDNVWVLDCLRMLPPSRKMAFIEDLDMYNIIKGLNMKFDCIVMNPPYQRNLHLKILAEAIKHLKDEKSVCVNLSPVRWLQDPLAKYKKNCDLKRFEESVAKHIESVDVYEAQDAQNLFNIVLGNDLGVYCCKKAKTKIKVEIPVWNLSQKCLEYVIKHNPTYEDSKKDGWRVRMPIMTGASGRNKGSGERDIALSSFGKLLAFKDGKNEEGKWWYDCYRKNQCSKCTSEISRSIKFATKDEAYNFIKQFSTSFGKYVTHVLTGYNGVGEESCLWLADAINPRTGLKGYKGEWTDDDLYKFFNITPEEQKTIEEMMEKYK